MTLYASGFSLESRGLNAEQQATVLAFKRILQQTGSWDGRVFDEHDCARFLKARNYDLQAAKQMWDSMLAWRRENRVDTIRDWFVFHERPDYDRVFPTGLHKTDKEGHPVLIQQLGRVNIGALYKVTTDDRIRLAHIAENEHLRRVVFPACSRAARRPIDQLFTIIDLDGVAFTSMMRTTSLLKMFMTMDSNNYPETLAHMAIINAPGWFSTSWGAVKSVLSGDTVRKIEILGKDYKAALLRHIPAENLLAEYGGLSCGRVTDNEGPWLQQQEEEELTPEPPAPPLSLAGAATVTAVKLQISSGTASMSVAVAGALMEAEALGAPEPLELSGDGGGARDGDQRTPRDVLTRRSQSPVRPGAKVAAAPPGPAPDHPAPSVSPPLPKRLHVEELQLQAMRQQQQPPAAVGHAGTQPQPQLGLGLGSDSPAPSVSDSASDSAQNMTAPLMSNFLPSSESASPQQQLRQQQQLAQHRHHPPTPPRQSSPQASTGGAAATAAITAAAGAPATSPLALQRGSSGGGASGLVAGFVATLHAAVGHGTGQHQHHHHHHQQVQASATAADGGVLRPPAGPSAPFHGLLHGGTACPQTPLQHQHLALARGGAPGPAQLLLNSPREDATGPGTMLSVMSAIYSPPSLVSPLSPMDMHGMADTATSRRTDSGSGSLGGASLLGSGPAGSAVAGSGPGRGGASGGGFSSLPNVPIVAPSMPSYSGSGLSTFNSAVLASGELLPGSSASAAPMTPLLPSQQQQQQHTPAQLQQQQQLLNDADDTESVRFSVMSQRSFYSALSHLDQSSNSGLISPNEGSENARRWSMQRELHAAAIASALAATAERRAAAAAGGGGGGGSAPAAPAGGSLAKASITGTTQPGPTVAIPPASTLSGVSYIIPPAAQQSFGSYLDQPPSYSALRAACGPGSFTNGEGRPVAREVSYGSSAGVGGTGHGGEATEDGTEGHRGTGAPADAVAIHMASDSNGGVGAGGLSRSPSAAAMEDCSLGAGAVRWARGWFFRRRNYGRLVETDGAVDGAGAVGSGQVSEGVRQAGTMMARVKVAGASVSGLYASMQDGPCSTSPSKLMPKIPSGSHHARGDSWEWDQPSPYDIDQTYSRGGGGGSGAGHHRELSYGRGSERRRLLRSESPGRRHRLGDYCGCVPCCNVM